jgi:DNA recombination protein RmuC
MDTLLYLALGLILGIIVGYAIAAARKSRAGNSEVELAAARATIEGLSAQLVQLKSEVDARSKRDAEALAEENRILQELAPVRERVAKMQSKIEELEKERLEQFSTIKQQLIESSEQQRTLGENTKALAGALNNKQARGQWGELTLRRLLENSGMLPHVDFFEQQVSVNNDGKGIKPDCVINYPDGKFVAVDSKVPFDDYQRATAISEVASPEDEKKRKELMKAHVDAVKKHINDISGKNYYSGLPSSPEFTIMFMPSEGLLAATLDADPTILEFGFSKQVALVSPVSIFSVIRTISYGWRQSAQEETIKEVIDLGVSLHKYVRVVAEHAAKLGTQLNGAVGSYNAFVSSLERNLLTSTRKLNEKSKGILDGGKPVPELIEVDESVDTFTKPELTSAIESTKNENLSEPDDLKL